MDFDLQNAPIEKLKKTRALLNAHRHACAIYKRLGATTYHDGQPVAQALEQVNDALEQIDAELARRTEQPQEAQGPRRAEP